MPGQHEQTIASWSLTCSDVVVSVLLLIQWMSAGLRGVPWGLACYPLASREERRGGERDRGGRRTEEGRRTEGGGSAGF